MEEVSWRQKSRVLFLKEGDKCSEFFHTIANSNRRNNSIHLLIGGRLSTNQVEISEHIGQFYQKLFTKRCCWRPLVDGLSLDSILEFEDCWLERS
jgi:hypothetical protein